MRPSWTKGIPQVAVSAVRRPITWILVSCFLLRLVFVLSGAPTPVQFDARIYVSAALALSSAVTHPAIFFNEQARKSVSYDLVYADLVKGESVEWLYYDPPTFDEALRYVYFAGPIYPVLLGVVFWPDWAHDFAAARVVNAILDTVSCGLLFWILMLTAGYVPALIGAGLFSVYPGFIIKCGELNLEPLAACLVLLAVAFCVSGVVRGRGRWFFAAGVVAGALVLTKASLSLLVVFLGAALTVILWRERSLLWKALWRLAAGFALVALPWVMLIWAHYGAPGVRDPEYGAANFRSSNILAGRGYDLDFAPDDFWTYPVRREMAAHPGAYFALYVEKFYRLWNRPYNDYRIPLVVGVEAQLWFHRLLMLAATVGLAFWPRRESRYAALVPLAVVAYVSVVHTVWHSLTRYALPAAPLAVGAAGVAAVAVVEHCRSRMSFSRWAVIGAAVLTTYLAWGWLDVGRMLAWWSSLSPATANVLVTAVRAIVLTGNLIVLGSALGRSRRTVWLLGTFLMAGQALLWIKSMPQERWAEWFTTLSQPTQAVERTIYAPAGFEWGRFQQVCILADIQSGGGDRFSLVVQLDSARYPLPGGKYSQVFYPKLAYKPFLEAYQMKKEQIRHWVTFPLTLPQVDTLMADGRLFVRLSVLGGDRKTNVVRVYGDYRTRDWANWEGPTMMNPSVERMYEEGDPRIWEKTPRLLVSADNRRVERGQPETLDLSEVPGRQTGDYRIVIWGKTPAGKNVFF